MERRLLGRSGIEVSRLCLGTLTVGPLQVNMPPVEAAEIFYRAFELGVSFYDSALIYGTYPHLREFLKRVGRDKVVITAKSYDYTYEGMRANVEKALRDIGTDYVDIYLMHEQESRATLQGHSEGFRYLEEAKRNGIIRATGVSTHACEVVEAAPDLGFIDVIHPMFNYKGLGMIDGGFDRMQKAVASAHAAGLGVYAMKVLGGGLMIDELPQAIRWAASCPDLDSIALGIASTEELEIDVELIEGGEPDSSRIKVASKGKAIIIEEWCTGCGSCQKACGQGAIEIREGRAFVDKSKCILCGYCGRECPDFHIRIV